MTTRTILSPGATVGGKYEVLEVIGYGGMGVVYKVREQVGAVSRTRALKTVLPQYVSDRAIATRFREEAEKMCMLEHENLVPVIAYSEEGEFPFLVMPFIEGQTLKQYLASHVAQHGRGLPLSETMEIGLQVVRGLEAAHRFEHPETHRPQPMVHRDIKPGNIMVRIEDESGERRLKVLIMDFGIAKVLSAEDRPGTLTEVIGTVKYAAPEQIRRGKMIDPRADIYSLGVVLYELYCGQNPFASLPEQTVMMRMIQKDGRDQPITFPDEAPQEFRELILRSVAFDRERRFQNVGEMRTLMRRILEEHSERSAVEAERAAEFARAERDRALAQNASQFAAAALADAHRHLAAGDAALAERRLPQAIAAMREAAELFGSAADEANLRQDSRRAGAVDACDELDQALAATEATLAALPASLRSHDGTSSLELVQAGARAARASLAAGEFTAATRTARDARASLTKLQEELQPALAAASAERERVRQGETRIASRPAPATPAATQFATQLDLSRRAVDASADAVFAAEVPAPPEPKEFPWRIAALGGGIAAALAMILWLALGRGTGSVANTTTGATSTGGTAAARAPQQWIDAYCRAFETKDTDTLLALGHLHGAGEASRLRDSLAAMKALRVSCSNASIRESGGQAVVSFDRTDHWVDSRGVAMERALPHITKTLRHDGDKWVAVP